MKDERLIPRLRQEIRLHQKVALDGLPAWQLYDPIQHRYFMVPNDILVWLRSSKVGATVADLKEQLQKQQRSIDDALIHETIDFIEQQQLCYAPAKHHKRQGIKELFKHPKLWQLPLWDPNPLLTRASPVLHSYRWIWTVWLVFTLMGLYLVSRQWDQFTHTFAQYLTWSHSLIFIITLIALKAFHELGHAYMGYRQGCHVGKVGVALFMGLPMFYTELSDAARITNGHKRMWIASGGIIAESLIAGLATFLWAVLPDGSARALCFVIATTSWITTIAINMNPFARFDGYYFLSDALNTLNLQPRSLALSRYLIRRILWGPHVDSPEAISSAKAKLMIAYGIGVWIYQTLLLLGIGYIAYRWLTPSLGIIILAYMAVHSLLNPLLRLVRDSRKLRVGASKRRQFTLLGITIVLLALLILPLNRSVQIPAMMSWQGQQIIAPPADARLSAIYVHDGEHVNAGQTIATFESPELTQQIRETELTIGLLQKRLNRIADSAEDRVLSLQLNQQLEQANADLAGLRSREKQLTWQAPQSGRVVDLVSDLAPGQWFRPDQSIGRILINHQQVIIGYIDEALVKRTLSDRQLRFIPNNLSLSSINATWQELDSTAATQIFPYELASSFAGPIATELNNENQPTPIIAMYRLRAKPINADEDIHQSVYGQLTVHLTPRSLLGLAGEKLWRLTIAELGQ